jgi:hypothetical protein
MMHDTWERNMRCLGGDDAHHDLFSECIDDMNVYTAAPSMIGHDHVCVFLSYDDGISEDEDGVIFSHIHIMHI